MDCQDLAFHQIYWNFRPRYWQLLPRHLQLCDWRLIKCRTPRVNAEISLKRKRCINLQLLVLSPSFGVWNIPPWIRILVGKIHCWLKLKGCRRGLQTEYHKQFVSPKAPKYTKMKRDILQIDDKRYVSFLFLCYLVWLSPPSPIATFWSLIFHLLHPAVHVHYHQGRIN